MIFESKVVGEILIKLTMFRVPPDKWYYRATANPRSLPSVRLAKVCTRPCGYDTLTRKGKDIQLARRAFKKAETNFARLMQLTKNKSN